MAEWRELSVADCLENVALAQRRNIPRGEYKSTGRFPVVDQGQGVVAGWTDDESAIINTSLPVVLFGDHTRAVKYLDFPFARGADGTQILRPVQGIDAKFFYFALKGIEIPSRGYNRHFQQLREAIIRLPGESEQRIIARLLSAVESSVRQQEAQLLSVQQLLRAVITRLFSTGLNRELQRHTELGPVPKSWQLVKLGLVFETQLGKMLSERARAGHSPKPYLRNKNVQWGQVNTEDVAMMDFDEREMSKYRLLPGDLLICEGGIIGRSAIWKGELAECYYQKALHRVRPRSTRCSNEFLHYWMRYAFEHESLYQIGGASSTIAHLPKQLLDNLVIPVPSPAEQASIVEVLSTLDAKLAMHRRKRTILEELFKSLLRKLLTGEIRVADLNLDALDGLPATKGATS